jgi:dTDP-4-dehydrorhamnose 3,5-epimerase
MKIIDTPLNDCFVIEPDIFEDERGFFLETYNSNKYMQINNFPNTFVQDNHSKSYKNTLRGLHLQLKKPQGKLVRVVSGEVFDVAVDLRPNSSSFGFWHAEYLNEVNKKQLWIPPGFAHGFLVISDEADFEYKCSELYYPEDEVCIIWNDPKLNIGWPTDDPFLSNKDANGLSLGEIKL